MKKLDRYERGILSAYNKGALVSARPTKERVNIRLPGADLMDAAQLTRRLRVKNESCRKSDLWRAF